MLTLPRRERRKQCAFARVQSASFNPRSRMGSDRFTQSTVSEQRAFQSTLPVSYGMDRKDMDVPHWPCGAQCKAVMFSIG